MDACSPLLLLTCGYAILDGVSMPVLAEGDAEPNDTFCQQIVASAEAAVRVSHPTGPYVSGSGYLAGGTL